MRMIIQNGIILYALTQVKRGAVMNGLNVRSRGAGEWVLENLSPSFSKPLPFSVSWFRGVSVGYFFSEFRRVFRNSFLVLSLIILVLRLGLNFGIVIGAMSGQAAIAIARY